MSKISNFYKVMQLSDELMSEEGQVSIRFIT